jgi:hypothetical protein
MIKIDSNRKFSPCTMTKEKNQEREYRIGYFDIYNLNKFIFDTSKILNL